MILVPKGKNISLAVKIQDKAIKVLKAEKEI
jgi:hypothetical protein